MGYSTALFIHTIYIDYIASSGAKIDEWRFEKDLEGSCRGLIEVIIH
jgi:hypothetical protein